MLLENSLLQQIEEISYEFDTMNSWGMHSIMNHDLLLLIKMHQHVKYNA